MLERAKNRALTSNRKDDKDVNKHLKRIEDFVVKTLPAIEYFKTKVLVKNINGEGTIEEVTESVAQEIKSL